MFDVLLKICLTNFKHGFAHGFGVDGIETEGDVAGADAAGYGLADCGFNGTGSFFFSETVAEHKGGGEDLCAGLAIRCPAMSGAVPPDGS